jgi:hypothetical protein
MLQTFYPQSTHSDHAGMEGGVGGGCEEGGGNGGSGEHIQLYEGGDIACGGNGGS